MTPHRTFSEEDTMLSFIGMIIAGAVLGALARLVMRGEQNISVLWTIVLGAVGALVGGATVEQARALYAVGIQLGLAFQIQDDLLDVYGEEKTFGKPIGGDIVNAKKTLLLLYTLEQLQGEDLKRLQEILTYTPEERRAYIDEVRALYDKAGTRLYTEAEIERLTAEAYHGVEQLPLREEGRELLLALFHTLSGRTK